MAPEQLAGREVTERSDIYSLGLVLFELFTGKRVFEASSRQDLMRLHEIDSVATPTSLVRDLDPAVERAILRCLERDAAKRPPSALAVSAALPGGDQLAAALAAGETPSPEMVAAAGEQSALRPGIGLALVAFTIVMLGILSALSERLGTMSAIPLPKSTVEVVVRRGGPDAAVVSRHRASLVAPQPVGRAQGLGRTVPRFPRLDSARRSGVVSVLTVLLRFGLLALVVTFYTFLTMELFPLTIDISRPYAGASLVVMMSIAAVAAYGFDASRGAEPFFGRTILE